ncbi:MAG TPA: Hsp20 family protein [Stellaceae bacterium]
MGKLLRWVMAAKIPVPDIFNDSPASPAGGVGADQFPALRREMNRLFDEMLRGLGPSMIAVGSTAAMPPVNVSEDDREFRISAELPGVNEKDVEITLQDDVLTIRGEKAEREDRQRSYHMAERSFGAFARTLRLPFAVQPDEVQASFENGVLTVTLPKPALDPRNAYRIQVRPSGGGATARIGEGMPDPAFAAAASGVADEQRYQGTAEGAVPRYEVQPGGLATFASDADRIMSSDAREDPFIARVCAKLGLQPLRSDVELLEQVERGLPVDAVRALAGSGASQAEVYELVIPRRTMDHRTANGQPLTRDESDKLVRVARVIALAEIVFGDPAKAERWLRKPKTRLAGGLPMQRLATDMGARLVEEMLQQIDHGIAA